jgi:hypothetical protein
MKFKTLVLLEAVESLPTHNYVMKHNDGHITRKIIDPLKKGLDELQDNKQLKWEYCNKNGLLLTNSQLTKSRKWKDFSESYIRIYTQI